MASGMGYGCILFVLSRLGCNVYFRWGFNVVEGIGAGFLNLIADLILGALTGFLASFIGFFPFKFLLRLFLGIALKVKIDQPLQMAAVPDSSLPPQNI